MYNGRRSPWVRETAAVQPFLTWTLPVAGHTAVEWRDAVIVNAAGEFAGLQSLTDDSLAVAANATRLSNALRAAASRSDKDTDLDGLPDDWELTQLGTVAHTGAADPMGAGRSLFSSYAQGLPVRYAAQQGPLISRVMVGSVPYFQMEFRRRLGLEGVTGTLPARLTYTPQVHANGVWSNAAWVPISDTDPWDGTGTRKIVMRSPVPAAGAAAPKTQFVRLKITAAE